MRLPVVSFALVLFLAACGGDPSDGGRSTGGSSGGTTSDGAPLSPPPASPGTPASSTSGEPPQPPSSPPAPPPPPKVNVTNETLDVSGTTRAFVLAVPRNRVPSKAYPLVLVLHGDGGDGVSMRAAMPMDDVTGEDAIVAYPSGLSSTWRLYQPAAENPDFAFIGSLVGSLVTRFGIDSTRVFATGFSSGAFMSNQIACRQPSLLRAIASHGGGAPAEPEDGAASSWPNGFTQCAGQTTGVAALIVHGTDDGVVGGASGQYSARYWGYVNGCGTEKQAAQPAFPAPCTRQASCPNEHPVVLCDIPGLGHSLWGQAMQTTWSFFKSF